MGCLGMISIIGVFSCLKLGRHLFSICEMEKQFWNGSWTLMVNVSESDSQRILRFYIFLKLFSFKNRGCQWKKVIYNQVYNQIFFSCFIFMFLMSSTKTLNLYCFFKRTPCSMKIKLWISFQKKIYFNITEISNLPSNNLVVYFAFHVDTM